MRWKLLGCFLMITLVPIDALSQAPGGTGPAPTPTSPRTSAAAPVIPATVGGQPSASGAGSLSTQQSASPSPPVALTPVSQQGSSSSAGAPARAGFTGTQLALFLFALWGLAFLGYLLLSLKTKRGQWFRFLHVHHQSLPFIFAGAATLAAVCVATSVSAHGALSILASRDIPDYLLSPGTLFAFLALTVTLAGFLNTMVVRERQGATFEGFGELSARLYQLYSELHGRLGGEGDGGAPTEEVYLVDYSTRPGDISDASAADKFHNYLKRIAALERCRLYVAVFPKKELVEYYTGLTGAASTDVLKTVHEAENSLGQIESLSGVTSWRSSKILSEHYVMSKRMAIMYTVVQTEEGNGKKNRVQGEVTCDGSRIAFLEQTARAYIRHAITPEWNSKGLVWDSDQPGVQAIRVIAVAAREALVEGKLEWGAAEEISVTNGITAGVEYPFPPSLGSMDYAKIRLVKGPAGKESPSSAILCKPKP